MAFQNSVDAKTQGVQYLSTPGSWSGVDGGTAGNVLTSNGTGVAPSFQATAVTGITTINGDTGSITGTTVTIKAGNSTQNSGSSVLFTNSGTTSTLGVTDANLNTLVGQKAGNATLSGTDNTGLGYQALLQLTSGSDNTAIGLNALDAVSTGNGNTGCGESSLNNVTTGSNNTALGTLAGNSLTTSDSHNIMIKNGGTSGDNNTIRIGTQGSGSGQQNLCFIAGITGVTTTVANRQLVTVNSSTTQVGTSAFSTVIQVFTSTGTYTPTSGMVYCIIRMVGGGGGGGGTTSTSGVQFSSGGGGGSGEYGEGTFSASTIGASQTVTIGAAGTGGAVGGGGGGTGGTTSVGTLLTAIGGGGGGGSGAAAATYVTGGAGGTGGTGGAFHVPGWAGDAGWSYFVAGILAGGNGEGSLLGARSLESAQNATGTAGANYGSGGSGALITQSATQQAGGAGSKGLVVVTEYIIS